MFLALDRYNNLQQSLPLVFQCALDNEEATLARIYPLLLMIDPDAEHTQQLSQQLQFTINLSAHDAQRFEQVKTITHRLIEHFSTVTPFKYALPHLVSAAVVYQRDINRYIQDFNTLIANYHAKREDINESELANKYQCIVNELNKQGGFFQQKELEQLLLALINWTDLNVDSLRTLFSLNRTDNIENPPEQPQPLIFPDKYIPRSYPEVAAYTPFVVKHLIAPGYDFSYMAGRLGVGPNIYLINTIFATKPGGHADAQAIKLPFSMTAKYLFAVMERQLAHRLVLHSDSEVMYTWLLHSLTSLGVHLHALKEGEEDAPEHLLIYPFLSKPLLYHTLNSVISVLKEEQKKYPELNVTPETLQILAQYLRELLALFQSNPGEALGIGANFDGTIARAQEGGSYSFRINPKETDSREFIVKSVNTARGPLRRPWMQAVVLKLN